jgi:membrane-associated phospholipid phosphatase
VDDLSLDLLAPCRSNRNVVSLRFIAIWLALTLTALLLDQRLAACVHASRLDLFAKTSLLCSILKSPGTISFTVVLMLFSWFWSPRSSVVAVLLLASAAASGLFYSLAKWAVGRSRPLDNAVLNAHPFQIHPFDGGLAGLFIPRPDQSFPSGHVSLAFATAAVMAIYYPRGRLFFFTIAGLVAVERILESAHYLSDVVAGSGLGIMAAFCAVCLGRRYFVALHPRQNRTVSGVWL